MSEPAPESHTVPERAAGIRLRDFLEREFAAYHRASLRAALASGEVYVNGIEARKNVRLGPFDQVELRAAPAEMLPPPRRLDRDEAADLQVLHESAHCLVVAKPAGLPTVPARSGREPGVHGRLAQLRSGADLRIVHRLDRQTSGCLLLAKGLAAARHFDAAFRAGAVGKTYLALVPGRVGPDEQTVDLYLGPDPRRPGKVVAARTQRRGFRSASTRVVVAQRYRRFTLLRLLPRTGRGHQLRVHLRAIGHPIVADADYGGAPLLLSDVKSGYKARAGVVERPLLERTFLHAAELRFDEPGGEPVVVAAPLPADLQLVLDKLARFGGQDGPRQCASR